MLHFLKRVNVLLFGFTVTLILHLDAHFSLHCVRGQIRYSINLAVDYFPKVTQRKIMVFHES